MSDHLSPEIIIQILLRLSLKPLLRFRLVSKQWLAQIDDPDFDSRHVHQSTVTNTNNLLFIQEDHGNLYSSNFNDLRPGKTLTFLAGLYLPPRIGTSFIDTCDGLITARDEQEDLLVFNPGTSECKEIFRSAPPYNPMKLVDGAGVGATGYGFGYDRVADDYKVVRIVETVDQHSIPQKAEAWVFHVKKGIRTVVEMPYLVRRRRPMGELVNGSLHWPLGYSYTGNEIMLEVDEERLVWLDLMSKSVHKIQIRGLQEDNFQAIVCVASLVSPKPNMKLQLIELNEEVVDMMSKDCPVLTVGPTIPSFYLDKRIENDDNYGLDLRAVDRPICFSWLNTKPMGSVVYVAFGSLVQLSEKQIEELAWGLKQSNFYFLWAIRPSEEAKLPKTFKEEVGEKGLTVNWTNQVKMLSHESVGCFLTHCGWNSTMEGLSLGVPMVAMPVWSDEPMNAKLVEDVWKVGVRVKVDEDGIVKREEIELCIKQVMEGERARELKENARKWRELAIEAVNEGGSSDRNLNEFASKSIKSHSQR